MTASQCKHFAKFTLKRRYQCNTEDMLMCTVVNAMQAYSCWQPQQCSQNVFGSMATLVMWVYLQPLMMIRSSKKGVTAAKNWRTPGLSLVQ